MNINFQALQIVIILLPGFVTQFNVSYLVTTRQKSELDKIIAGIFYSFIIYTVFSLISDMPLIFAEIIQHEKSQNIAFNFNGKAFAILFAISFFFAVITSISYNYDVHMRFLRFLKITRRTSRSSLWIDVFSDKKSYVIVNFKDNQRAINWPEYYSEEPGQEYLFLSQASWIDKGNKAISINGPGLLMTSSAKIESIEFVSGKKKEEEK